MTAVRLFHREFGDAGAPAVVILHGLLGSSRNWQTAAGALAERLRVFALDLRNHGESPRTAAHDMDLLRADLLRWLDERGLGAVHLLGHSLGGKVAMQIACRDPARVERLTVVDVAPKAYPILATELIAMRALDLAALESRKQAEDLLAADVPDRAMRQFLASQLERGEDGRFSWKPNLDALIESLPATRRAPLGPGERYLGPTLFVVGERSGFVRDRDHDAIRAYFPEVSIRAIPASGHNPHIDARDAFVACVLEFALGPSAGRGAGSLPG